jgi:putative AlgH/UPF0301 family transcriptional regulator
MAVRAWFAGALAAMAVLTPLAAQSQKASDIAIGKLLVANRKVEDPNFRRTVVLVLVYQADAAVGLILNRRSHMSIASVYDLPEAKGRTDVVYGGGPVERASTLALLRAPSSPEGATHIVKDVYLISGHTPLRRAMGSDAKAESLRVFVGYAGWTGPQLQHEVETGGWYIFPGDARTIFDTEPQTLWQRMVERVEGLLAIRTAKDAAAQRP